MTEAIEGSIISHPLFIALSSQQAYLLVIRPQRDMNVINTIKIVITALSLALPTSAHSWIEEYQVIDSNGKYIGDKGYSRGYIARTDPAFTGSSMTYLIPQVGNRINPTDMLCHPDQRTSNYFNPAYPKLKVQPGGYVAMKYLENGHVTLPWNHRGKPKPARTVFVYGTMQPSPHEKNPRRVALDDRWHGR